MQILTIDGSEGEGGGQILRTSLALSIVTCQPFRMVRVRAKRQKPGLLRQHLTAVEAAKQVACADVQGAVLGSQTLEFRPGPVTPGNYLFAVGTAGSATLVLQTVLPALLTADGPSTLTLEGGTHNPMAPPFDFLAHSFIPLLQRMGPSVELRLWRHGFFPAGGGRFHTKINPVKKLLRLDLPERGAIRSRNAKVIVSKLPEHVCEREMEILKQQLHWGPAEYSLETVPHPLGPGNAVILSMEAEHATGIFTGFGERGRAAEEVAYSAVTTMNAWLEANVPVDEHLADQLLIPLVIAGGGSFRTTRPSLHSTTNASTIQRFIPASIQFQQENDLVWSVRVETGERAT